MKAELWVIDTDGEEYYAEAEMEGMQFVPDSTREEILRMTVDKMYEALRKEIFGA